MDVPFFDVDTVVACLQATTITPTRFWATFGTVLLLSRIAREQARARAQRCVDAHNEISYQVKNWDELIRMYSTMAGRFVFASGCTLLAGIWMVLATVHAYTRTTESSLEWETPTVVTAISLLFSLYYRAEMHYVWGTFEILQKDRREHDLKMQQDLHDDLLSRIFTGR